jgi:hypothetical protein
MKIEIFFASMLPPAKRERGGCGKNCFCVFVYFIYSTTLLMHGIVKKNLLHDQTVYIYIFIYYVDMNMMHVNCTLGNSSIDAKNISIFIFGPEQRYYY